MVCPEQELRFYASAYNGGFHRPEPQTQKFNYADIAVWFYNNLLINCV
jgi:hypothetical protein